MLIGIQYPQSINRTDLLRKPVLKASWPITSLKFLAMKRCRYRFCNKMLSFLLNGNRQYCDDSCSYAERLLREEDKRKNRKEFFASVRRYERLLGRFYLLYGSDPFNANQLSERNMNWSIFTSLQIHGDDEYRCIGKFGYQLLNNGKVKLNKFLS